MGFSTTAAGELFVEVDGTVEAKAAVLIEVDIKSLKVSRGVDDTDVSSLNEVVCDNQVLLVRSNLDVVGADGGLVLIGVIQSLDIVEIADIKSCNVVCGGQSKVDVFAILGDVGAVGERG